MSQRNVAAEVDVSNNVVSKTYAWYLELETSKKSKFCVPIVTSGS